MSEKFKKYYKQIELEDDEDIQMVIRHHFLPYIHKIILALVLLTLPFFLMFSLISQGPIGVSIFVALIILSLVYASREYFVWSRNVFIVTDKKIIDVDQRGFFSKTVSEVPFQKVLDIAYTSKGVMPTIFGTGLITVTTSIPNLSLEISHVGSVKKTTAELIAFSQEGGMKINTELTLEDKIRNFEEVVNDDDDDEIHHYQLKDLLAEYVEKYSKNQLKKLLLRELKDRDGDE